MDAVAGSRAVSRARWRAVKFGALAFAAWLGLPLASSAEALPLPPASPTALAAQKLRAAGASEPWIALLQKRHDPEERDKIVELNVLGYLAGKAVYSDHYSPRALRRCKAFLRKYRVELARAEERHGVPKEVIAALLWVETKHGTYMGKYDVADVYFSLLQADHPDVMKSTFTALASRLPASEASAPTDHRQKVTERSASKSTWALEELAALEAIHKRSPKRKLAIKGSYAGAFGIPQFIPSSYLKWAQSSRKQRAPDLFNMSDAIESVGFYLKSNGWSPTNRQARRDALYHYNRADEYGTVILKIARAVKGRKLAADDPDDETLP
jgi:membrane-bound lytic murein transglycosylase B